MDYEPVNLTVNVPIGGTQNFIQLNISSDMAIENPEDFRMVLNNPSFGAVISEPSVLYIIDTACELSF